MKRIFPAWIAIAAIFLQAVWPLLSHARPPEAPQFVPLCTISGETHFLELKTGKQTPLDERSANHGEHCKLCVFEGPKDVGVLLQLEVFASSFFEAGKAFRVEAQSKAATLLSARSRAPPAIT